jgi:hypothetical protein
MIVSAAERIQRSSRCSTRAHLAAIFAMLRRERAAHRAFAAVPTPASKRRSPAALSVTSAAEVKTE